MAVRGLCGGQSCLFVSQAGFDGTTSDVTPHPVRDTRLTSPRMTQRTRNTEVTPGSCQLQSYLNATLIDIASRPTVESFLEQGRVHVAAFGAYSTATILVCAQDRDRP
jgi:hypothetical protein